MRVCVQSSEGECRHGCSSDDSASALFVSQTKYLRRKPNKRMDTLIGYLLRIETDFYMKYKRIQYGFLQSKFERQFALRLESSRGLSAAGIRHFAPGTYSVPSSTPGAPPKILVARRSD